jgi:hypothetical protein
MFLQAAVVSSCIYEKLFDGTMYIDMQLLKVFVLCHKTVISSLETPYGGMPTCSLLSLVFFQNQM